MATKSVTLTLFWSGNHVQHNGRMDTTDLSSFYSDEAILESSELIKPANEKFFWSTDVLDILNSGNKVTFQFKDSMYSFSEDLNGDLIGLQQLISKQIDLMSMIRQKINIEHSDKPFKRNELLTILLLMNHSMQGLAGDLEMLNRKIMI